MSIARARSAEQAIAAILESAPECDYAVLRCKEAWADLSTERTIGMVAGPIPWTSIVAWCDFHGLDHEATQIMIFVIRRLDIEHAEREAAKRRLEEMKRKRGQR